MNIIATRRICQVFFIVLFLWFCLATTLGERWWQLRGWPVNWIIQLDPLVGLGTLLSTRTLYAGLLWGLATVVLTIVLGRFFCGWLCPFGSLHQFIGFLAKRKSSIKSKLVLNRYHSAQSLKYWILVFLLTMAIAELAIELTDLVQRTRERKATVEEMKGGTFTITNVGPMGGGFFAPIINYPEVAILGMGSTSLQPVVREKGGNEHEIVPRLMMPIVLCIDHRVLDGADALRFIKVIKDSLEDPDELLMTMI